MTLRQRTRTNTRDQGSRTVEGTASRGQRESDRFFWMFAEPALRGLCVASLAGCKKKVVERQWSCAHWDKRRTPIFDLTILEVSNGNVSLLTFPSASGLDKQALSKSFLRRVLVVKDGEFGVGRGEWRAEADRCELEGPCEW